MFGVKELEVMETLWNAERPLTSLEIINYSVNHTWSNSSLHGILNNLLKKGAISVAGFERTGRTYGRTYKTKITSNEYAIMQFKRFMKREESNRSITNLASALLENKDNEEAAIEVLKAKLLSLEDSD